MKQNGSHKNRHLLGYAYSLKNVAQPYSRSPEKKYKYESVFHHTVLFLRADLICRNEVTGKGGEKTKERFRD